eukprot:7050889-Karenia_brevis.AAC.1
MGTRMTHVIFAKKIMIELKMITWTRRTIGIQFPLKINAMNAAAGIVAGLSHKWYLNVASIDLLTNIPNASRMIACGGGKKF